MILVDADLAGLRPQQIGTHKHSPGSLQRYRPFLAVTRPDLAARLSPA
jgi:hypothetical protein